VGFRSKARALDWYCRWPKSFRKRLFPKAYPMPGTKLCSSGLVFGQARADFAIALHLLTGGLPFGPLGRFWFVPDPGLHGRIRVQLSCVGFFCKPRGQQA
jgi:hypothetical protein